MDGDTDWEDIAESPPTPVNKLSAMVSESPFRSSSTKTITVDANLLREVDELRSENRRLREELEQLALVVASKTDKDKDRPRFKAIVLRSIPKLVYRSDDAGFEVPFKEWPNPKSPYRLLPGAIRYHILSNFSMQTDQHEARASLLQQLQNILGPWSAEENPVPVIMFLRPEASRFEGAPRAVVDVRFITSASFSRAIAMAPQMTWDDQPLVQFQQRPWSPLEGLVIVFDGPANWDPEISNKHLAEHLEPFGRVVETWVIWNNAVIPDGSTMPDVPTGELRVLFVLDPGVKASELPGWMMLRQVSVYPLEPFQLYYEGKLNESERLWKDEGSSALQPSPDQPLTSATPSAGQPQGSFIEPSISSTSRQPQQSSARAHRTETSWHVHGGLSRDL